MKGRRRSRGLLLTVLGAAVLALGALIGPPLAGPVRADHSCAFIIQPKAGAAGSTFRIWSSYFLKRLTFWHDGEFVRVVELGRIPDEYYFETTARDAGRWDIRAESTGCEKDLTLWVTLPDTSTGTAAGSSLDPDGTLDDIGRVSLVLLFLGTAQLMLWRPASFRRPHGGHEPSR